MGFRHTAGMVVLGLFLCCSLVAANLVVGVNRTALSQDFVTDSLAEEDAYQQAVVAVQERVRNRTDSIPVDLSSILTPAYLRDQVERNVDRLYAYLHGRNDSLILSVNLSRLEPRIAEAAQTVVQQQLVGQDRRIGALLANQSSYQATKQAFKERQLQRIQATVPGNQTRQELLAIYEDQKSTIRQQLEGTRNFSQVPEELRPVARNITDIVFDALFTDMTYDTFTDRFNAAMANGGDAMAEATVQRVRDELPVGQDLTEEFDSSTTQKLDKVRKAISYISLAGLILPLLVLGLAAVFWWLAGSTAAALLGIGSVTALAGLVGAVVFTVADSVVASLLEEQLTGAPTFVADLLPGLVEQVVTAFMTQSTVLLLLGIVLVAAGLVVRYRDRLPV